MLSKYRVICLVSLVITLVSGCSQEDSTQVQAVAPVLPQVAAAPTHVLLNEPVTLHQLELASEALAVWKQYAAQRPTLLLLSNDPMLIRVPEQLDRVVSERVVAASRDELRHLSDYGQPSPLFMPGMTLDMALRQGWFSQLAWAFPSLDAGQTLSLEVIVDQFKQSGIADEAELASLTAPDKSVQGVLRGVPMTMAALPNLGALTGPVLVHIDQSYFQGMYKNEIATPLLQAVTETLRALRESKIQTLAVTFVNGNLDGRISLNVRFLQEVVAEMLEKPEMLDKPLPVNWQRQAQILYLTNFFKTDETRELALAMNTEQPNSAWVKFALYLSAVEHKQGSDALSFLAAAVNLDKMYAREYLGLSEMAYEKGRPDEAMRMLFLAKQAFPDDVQIRLNMARLAADMNETNTALHLVEQLQKNEWSPVYYAEMPEYLEGFAAFLKGAKTTVSQPEAARPAVDPRRQRILR